MRKLLGLMPAFGQPCISPFVSKAAYFLWMSGVDFELERLDPMRVKAETPLGKVPVLVEQDGTKIHDSSFIIDHVRRTYGDHLDADLSPAGQAVSVAFDRLLGENLYWSGAIEPRWRDDAGWARYKHDIVGGLEVLPPPVEQLLEMARGEILAQQRGHGMGRRPPAEVLSVFKTDLDAVSDFLADKPFFLGDRPHWIDASVYAFVGHVTFVPFAWAGHDYARSKKNLTSYLHRMRDHYGFPALHGSEATSATAGASAGAAAEVPVERNAA